MAGGISLTLAIVPFFIRQASITSPFCEPSCTAVVRTCRAGVPLLIRRQRLRYPSFTVAFNSLTESNTIVSVECQDSVVQPPSYNMSGPLGLFEDFPTFKISSKSGNYSPAPNSERKRMSDNETDPTDGLDLCQSPERTIDAGALPDTTLRKSSAFEESVSSGSGNLHPQVTTPPSQHGGIFSIGHLIPRSLALWSILSALILRYYHTNV
ncbi:hypothetical protein AAMO2058_000137000 [Amorphochlora amoebiformis]